MKKIADAMIDGFEDALTDEKSLGEVADNAASSIEKVFKLRQEALKRAGAKAAKYYMEGMEELFTIDENGVLGPNKEVQKETKI